MDCSSLLGTEVSTAFKLKHVCISIVAGGKDNIDELTSVRR